MQIFQEISVATGFYDKTESNGLNNIHFFSFFLCVWMGEFALIRRVMIGIYIISINKHFLSLSKTIMRNFTRELNEMFDNQNTSDGIIFPHRPLKRRT